MVEGMGMVAEVQMKSAVELEQEARDVVVAGFAAVAHQHVELAIGERTALEQEGVPVLEVE